MDNEPQPDAVLLIDARHGGTTRLSDDGYIEGAPEFVAEIAASTAIPLGSIPVLQKPQMAKRSLR